jgi:hypothetical protein
MSAIQQSECHRLVALRIKKVMFFQLIMTTGPIP